MDMWTVEANAARFEKMLRETRDTERRATLTDLLKRERAMLREHILHLPV